MFKHKKAVVYRLAGKDEPIAREHLDSYNNMSMFFVCDGLVTPITPSTDHRYLDSCIGGKYMYKNQLEEMIFKS